jgi:peptide/nickel transport system substrate-binding protein
VLVRRWDAYPGSQTPFFDNKGPAYLDAIRWTVITEAGQRATQLENGDIDTLLNPAHQDLARLESNPDLTVYRHAEWSGYFMFMNRENFPEIFGDVETRRGLSHAVDREGMVQALLFGNGAATYGPFPTTDRYYDPAVERFNNFDVAEGNRLLDAAGWSMGGDGVRTRDGVPLQFEFMVENESLQTAIATAAAAQFAQVGAQADVNVVDRSVWFERAGGPEVAAGLFMWLWPIPIDVLTLFCASYTIPVPNWSHANEPRIDQAIADWQTAGTEEAAAKAQSDFQVAWAEQLPNMSFINQNSTFVKNNRVHGWSPFVWLLYPYYNDTWIEA